MIRNPVFVFSAFALGFVLNLGHAHAAPHGSFPAGARLYSFGGPPVTQSRGKTEAIPSRSDLAGPLDLFKFGSPTRTLEYPFLNPIPCSGQKHPCDASIGSVSEPAVSPRSFHQ